MIPLVDNRFGHVTKLFYALFHPSYFPFSPCDSSVVPRSSYTAPCGLLSAPAGFLTHSFFIAEAVRRKSAAGRPSHISGPRTSLLHTPLHAFVSDVHSGCHTQTLSSLFFVSNRRLTTQTRHSKYISSSRDADHATDIHGCEKPRPNRCITTPPLHTQKSLSSTGGTLKAAHITPTETSTCQRKISYCVNRPLCIGLYVGRNHRRR
jgi:hypothetical protein